MNLENPVEVIAATTQCKKRFACLARPLETMCRADYCVGGKFLFLKCASPNACPYAKPFGRSCYCVCPTRLAIYNRFLI